MKTTILSIFVISFSFVNSIEAKNFKIASYNVQNLFKNISYLSAQLAD